MRIETKKTLGWIALLLGVGGTLVFWFAYFVNQIIAPGLGVWIVCHLALLMAPFYLRRLYRIQPMPPLGLWQLTTRDLFAATVVVGGLLAFYQGFRRELFLPNGVILATVVGVLFVAGLLVAARKGHRDRYLFASAYAACAAGLIGASAFLLILIVVTAQFGPDVIENHFYATFVYEFPVSMWPEYLHRYSLWHLPVGLVLYGQFWLRRRTHLHRQELPAAAPASTDAGT